jgi:hypothetical protein
MPACKPPSPLPIALRMAHALTDSKHQASIVAGLLFYR